MGEDEKADLLAVLKDLRAQAIRTQGYILKLEARIEKLEEADARRAASGEL